MEEEKCNKRPSILYDKTTGEYRVQDLFREGLVHAQRDLVSAHPLEFTERNHAVTREAMLFQTLRDTQGLYATMRLQMERKITSRVQRLPPLESSMISFDTLTGNYMSLAIEDVLGDESDVPFSFNTHAAMEKKLKLK